MPKTLLTSFLIASVFMFVSVIAQAKLNTQPNVQPHAQPHVQRQNLQTLAAKKSQIRRIYYDTNNHLQHYQLTQLENNEASAQGGTVKIYTHNHEIKKIEEVYFGEGGKVSFDYYYDHNQLYFIFQQTTHYNAPIYFDAPQDGLEAFDINKSTIEENRYYFYDGQMIEWLDNDKQRMPATSSKYKAKQNELLKASLFD